MKTHSAISLLALLLAALLWMGAMGVRAQLVVGGGEGYDLDYLTPKTYEIGGITFEGAGCGLGQKIGVARGEVVAQAEIARAQVSHNSISQGRGRSGKRSQ